MNDKKERKIDNLINLVENHTRTERHLEQYANIGDPKFKEMAKEKQAVREEQIDNMITKQVNQERQMHQIQQGEQKIDESGKYTL